MFIMLVPCLRKAAHEPISFRRYAHPERANSNDSTVLLMSSQVCRDQVRTWNNIVIKKKECATRRHLCPMVACGTLTLVWLFYNAQEKWQLELREHLASVIGRTIYDDHYFKILGWLCLMGESFQTSTQARR